MSDFRPTSYFRELYKRGEEGGRLLASDFEDREGWAKWRRALRRKLRDLLGLRYAAALSPSLFRSTPSQILESLSASSERDMGTYTVRTFNSLCEIPEARARPSRPTSLGRRNPTAQACSPSTGREGVRTRSLALNLFNSLCKISPQRPVRYSRQFFLPTFFARSPPSASYTQRNFALFLSLFVCYPLSCISPSWGRSLAGLHTYLNSQGNPATNDSPPKVAI